MKRRQFLQASAAAAGLGTWLPEANAGGASALQPEGAGPMRAGFARVSITPPVGTTMMGFGARDMDHGCEGVHDEIYVRALYLEQGDARALILGYDLCFLGREEVDRFKGAIGRLMPLEPSQILMNTSHNHVGPSVGTWYSAGYAPADRLYINDLERATVQAARQACDAAREVTLWCGETRSRLPVNRRRPNENGEIENRPNPAGKVYDKLPLCLLKDAADRPVCLLFSISTHPSMMNGWEISAEYPGAAMRQLDEYLGTAASLFLQGVGGDSKPCVIGDGVDRWQPGTWELMEEAGRIVAHEAIAILDAGLVQVAPDLRTASVEMTWALEPAPPRADFEALVADTTPEQRAKDIHLLWAAKQLELLGRYGRLPASISLSAHGVKLGQGLRIAGIEGEAVHAWGDIIAGFYGGGVTFPLGYTDGTGLYLPTSPMLPEGGYEVTSFWEYQWPSRLAPGMEDAVLKALEQLRDRGVA